MMRLFFKIKLSKEEYRSLFGMMLGYDLMLIAGYDEREMVIHIIAAILRRMGAKIPALRRIESKEVTLKLKQGEAAAVRYVLSHVELTGYEENIRVKLLMAIHQYFAE